MASSIFIRYMQYARSSEIEINQLHIQLTTYENNIRDLVKATGQSSPESARKKIAELMRPPRDPSADSAEKKLNSNIEEMKKSLASDAKQVIELLKKRLKEKRNEVRRQKADIQLLQEENEEKSSRIEALEKEIRDLNSSLERLNRTVDFATDQYELLKKGKEALEPEIAKLRLKISELENDLSRAKQDSEAALKEQSVLLSAKDKTIATNADLLAQLRAKISELESRYKSLQSSILEGDNNIHKLIEIILREMDFLANDEFYTSDPSDPENLVVDTRFDELHTTIGSSLAKILDALDDHKRELESVP